MDCILSLKNLTKIYDNRVVVDNASFDIERGSVCGLLGPNGAGKTTLIKMIMNLVKCDGGSVAISDNLKIRFLQDVPEFYEFYTVREYLHFILEISHYNENKDLRVEEVLSLLNLNSYGDTKIKKLSRGLRQKVGIAGTIIDNPDVLLLDEPVSALDPVGRKEMFDIIALLKGETTIVFSSHILNDVERVCDHIVLINNGKIVLNDNIKNISLDKQTVLVVFKNKEDLLKIKEQLNYDNNFSDRIEHCLEINGEDVDKLEMDIFALLKKNKIAVNSISIKKESLEEIFLREVRSND